jgi:hypothetical protein
MYPSGLADWVTQHDPLLVHDHKELVAMRTPEMYRTLVKKALDHLRVIVNNT